MFVYRLFCKANEKEYIGITADMKRRMAVHFNTKDPTVLGRAIRKYGRDSFSVEILEECSSWKQACQREQFYIQTRETRAPKGMNMTDGGEGVYGLHHTKETREKMSASHVGKNCGAENPMYGKVSPRKGTKMSPESRAKLSASCKGRPAWNKGKKFPEFSGENHPMFGKHYSEEKRAALLLLRKPHTQQAKDKISASNKGKLAGECHPFAKITSADVMEIRRCAEEKICSRKELAVRYKISTVMIGRIVRRASWAHI